MNRSIRYWRYLLVISLLGLMGCQNNLPPLPDGRYSIVAVDGQLNIYDIDDQHALVRSIPVRGMKGPRGIAAHAGTDRLYIPYLGNRAIYKKIRRHLGLDPKPHAYMLCLDLRTGKVLWDRRYYPSIDSLAISQDGKKLFMPSGEEIKNSGFWFVLDADTGDEIDRIDFVKGAHNTITSLDGEDVYLASLHHNYLATADVDTHAITLKTGPFSDAIRPFTVTRDKSLAIVTVDNLSGFEVGDLRTGEVLHSVQVEGYPWENPRLPMTQSHGVSLTPDETRVWVVDAHNRRVHVFDVSALPDKKPRQLHSIDVSDPNDARNLPKWINCSRDGRYIHVSTGHIIDTERNEIIAQVAPSRYFVEVHYAGGEPVEAYSRYGLGYGAESTAESVRDVSQSP